MRFTKFTVYLVFYVCCSFAPVVSSDAPIVVLPYAQYQGVPYLDPVSNETNTQFLGIRYAAVPVGKVSFLCFLFYNSYIVPLLITEDSRFRSPRPPQTTGGVQPANKQPPQCWQAEEGTAPTTPFGNSTVHNINLTRRLGTRSIDSSIPESSEDCLFLKYISSSIGVGHTLTTWQCLRSWNFRRRK